MTRIEHLKFCSICIHQKEGMSKGILCGLTDKIADFDEQCISFAEDPEIIEELKLKEIGNEVDDKMASTGKRFLNYLLDQVFMLIFINVLCLIIFIIIALIDRTVFYSILSALKESDNPLKYIISFIFILSYYIGFETITGRTIAKFITKTKVVTELGEKPGFKVIVIRSLCRFIPFEQFCFLFNDASGWHDTISNTKVINI